MVTQSRVQRHHVTISASTPWGYSSNKWDADGQLANTIYYTFKRFSKAQKVTAKFVKSVENAYGEPEGERNSSCWKRRGVNTIGSALTVCGSTVRRSPAWERTTSDDRGTAEGGVARPVKNNAPSGSRSIRRTRCGAT